MLEADEPVHDSDAAPTVGGGMAAPESKKMLERIDTADPAELAEAMKDASDDE